MPDPNATLTDEVGRTVLRLERVLRHPPERVWNALTEPKAQASWHPTPAEFEPAVGGMVRFSAEGGVPDMPDGEVTEWDPPRVLAHTWGEDRLRWELRPHDDGCLLILTQIFEDRMKAARDAAGWHLCLDSLVAALDGAPVERSSESEGPPEDWKELNRAYEKRFGIPPEKATPPPG
jgi:uncharacterized protein YndB with AHSA1/START domain